MEIELKLLIDEQDVDKLEKLPLLEAVTVGPRRTQEQRNVYFDTPDFALQSAGAGLRVRRIGDDHVQTLKAGGGVTSGLHQREEWETGVGGERPDLAALREAVGADSPYASLLSSPDLADRLAPVFVSTVTRAVRQLRLPTGENIEMAVDRGTLQHAQTEEKICEVELELKSGEPARLYTFALELLEFIPLRIGTLSKAERGYAMRLPPERKPVKAARLRLAPSMPVEEAFEAVVANCMRQVQGNEYAAAHGTDPDSVHQMRVGLRRLRSALDLFSGAIESPATIQEELKWLAAELGAARDWEVLAGSTLGHIENAVPADVDLDALKAAALARARANRDAAAGALRSPRRARLELQLAEWIAGRRWRDTLPEQSASLLGQPLKKFAKRSLKRAEARLRKRGEHLQGNDPELRHRARIAGKKARYATEFFESLYPKSRVKDYLSTLSALQQELGWLNDAAVGAERLAQLQQSEHAVATAAAYARGYLSACVHADSPRLARTWDKFTKTDVPYKH